MVYVINDGGKAASGRKGKSGDCVVRAIAIANDMDYDTAYRMLAKEAADYGFKRSARNGIHKTVSEAVLKKLGWVWAAAPKFKGRKARCADLYGMGMVIAKQAGHLVAVCNGIPYDTFDSSNRMVYGYWVKK
jgi:hypothetical protein